MNTTRAAKEIIKLGPREFVSVVKELASSCKFESPETGDEYGFDESKFNTTLDALLGEIEYQMKVTA